MRKLMIFIATSLDGYIAKPNDDLGFLNVVQKEGEDYGYNAFIKTIDTVIVGRKTYDWVMKQVPEFPHADKTCYIITRNARPSVGNLNFYSGDIRELVQGLKQQEGKDIFCDGGSEIIHELVKHDLVDEWIISIIPTLVGNGTRLFKDGRPEQLLELVKAVSYDTGLTQLHYKRVRS